MAGRWRKTSPYKLSVSSFCSVVSPVAAAEEVRTKQRERKCRSRSPAAEFSYTGPTSERPSIVEERDSVQDKANHPKKK